MRYDFDAVSLREFLKLFQIEQPELERYHASSEEKIEDAQFEEINT